MPALLLSRSQLDAVVAKEEAAYRQALESSAAERRSALAKQAAVSDAAGISQAAEAETTERAGGPAPSEKLKPLSELSNAQRVVSRQEGVKVHESSREKRNDAERARLKQAKPRASRRRAAVLGDGPAPRHVQARWEARAYHRRWHRDWLCNR